MFDLSIRDLTEITGGTLRCGALPPLGGEDEPLRRVVTDSRQVRPGDVFWALPGRRDHGAYYAEHALMQSALAVVVGGRHVVPWAGSCVIDVEDPVEALARTARWVRHQYSGTVVVVEQGAAQAGVVDYLQPLLTTCGSGHVHRHVHRSVPEAACALLQCHETDTYTVLELACSEHAELVPILALCDPSILAITSPQPFGSPTSVGRDNPVASWQQLVQLAGIRPTVLDGNDGQHQTSLASCGHDAARRAAIGLASALGPALGLAREDVRRLLASEELPEPSRRTTAA